MSLAIAVHGSRVRLTGAVDMTTAPGLRAELTELINAAGQGTELRVELDEVSIMDSSGLSVLVTTHRHATAKDVRLLLTGLPDHVSRMLNITGLTELLELER
jgi:anti-sigma B factor antagonist